MKMRFLEMRKKGYLLLKGKGIEIGAFEHPSIIPNATKLITCDRLTLENAQKLFPEVNCSLMNEPNIILDIDTDGLRIFPNESIDFVVLNHVIEHLVNPIKAVKEIFRSLKPNGHFAVSAPDKNYTFDKERPLTRFDDLLQEYYKNTTEAPLQKYYPLIQYIHKDLLHAPNQIIEEKLTYFKDRREHLNIWTADSFKSFLLDSFQLLEITAKCTFEVLPAQNEFEYFGVWKKC
jgi:SAM-dependent methyltransferase